MLRSALKAASWSLLQRTIRIFEKSPTRFRRAMRASSDSGSSERIGWSELRPPFVKRGHSGMRGFCCAKGERPAIAIECEIVEDLWDLEDLGRMGSRSDIKFGSGSAFSPSFPLAPPPPVCAHEAGDSVSGG